MALNRKIEELHERRKRLLMGGGEKALEKQKALGKRTARERIMALLDADSFNEYDLFVEHDARDFDMDKKILHGHQLFSGDRVFGHTENNRIVGRSDDQHMGKRGGKGSGQSHHHR